MWIKLGLVWHLTFWKETYILQGHFITMQSNMDVQTWTFWCLCLNVHFAEISLCQNVPVPTCPSARMFPCQNIPVPKCPFAEITLCQKVLVPKSPHAETSTETKFSCAGMSTSQKVPMPKSFNDEMSLPKCLLLKCQVLK